MASHEAPVPVLTAINGPCAGGALGIALAADLVLAGRRAFFSVPQVPELGIVPDLGATWLLPRVVGQARAMAMSLLGERISAEKAEQCGLAWQCVDDAELLAQAVAAARRLAASPMEAVSGTRRLIRDSWARPLREQLDEEGRWQMKLAGGAAG